MFQFPAVKSLVETWATEINTARVSSFSSTFIGIALPNHDIEAKLHHAGIIISRKITKVEGTNKEAEEKVLVGEAEAEQPVSTAIFTDQGSWGQGVGMSLYHSSPIARKVWDRADRHLWTIMVTHFPCYSPSPY